MNFGEALEALFDNKKVQRAGWNGTNQWIYIVPGSTFQVTEGRPLAAHLPVGETVNYRPHIDMRFQNGDHGVWSIAMGDVLANDWQIVE